MDGRMVDIVFVDNQQKPGIQPTDKYDTAESRTECKQNRQRCTPEH